MCKSVICPSLLFLPALFTCATSAWAQKLMTASVPGATFHLFNSDMSALEAGDVRKDLPCEVNSAKAILGFDLRFHTGYEVTIPLRELSGQENMLTILFRVTPEDDTQHVTYFSQKVRVPVIEDGAKGDALLQGTFDVGDGKYKIDWLMRDRAERLCTSYWNVEAALAPKDKDIALAMQHAAILPADEEQFKDEPPVVRLQREETLNVKVLVNFMPQNSRAASIQPADTSALVSILRSLSRDPHIGKFSVVAFNLHEQRVIHRQDAVERIDFPAIGEAIRTVSMGTVDLKRLGQKNGDLEFLSGLIRQELGNGEAPDAVIFAGPKSLVDEHIAPDVLKEVGEVSFPVFYMNYNLFPQAIPWRDAIGNAVRSMKGQEYTITRPRDLWFAVSEMVSRVVKSRNTRRLAAARTE